MPVKKVHVPIRLSCKISGVGEEGEVSRFVQLLNCSPIAIWVREVSCYVRCYLISTMSCPDPVSRMGECGSRWRKR